MISVLYLCVANSARSQMAEAITRQLFKNTVKSSSAGTAPSQVNPLAIQAMLESEIDISKHYSKSVEEFSNGDVTHVITLCAEENCPVYLQKAQRYHWPHADPHTIEDFRKIRDQLIEKIKIEIPKLIAAR